MNQWRKFLATYRLISWLLVFALILQFLIQLVIHVHHEHHSDPLKTETHIIDFHTLADQHDSNEHSEHHEIHELKSTPDFIIKKVQGTDTGSALIILLIIFIVLPLVLSSTRWNIPDKIFIRYLLFGASPPTRAPPSLIN